MSEMIERAAQSVDKAISLLKDPVWNDANESRKALCRNAARAAIEAIRKPTQSMISVSIEIERAGNDETNSTYELWPEEIEKLWQLMIDEALK